MSKPWTLLTLSLIASFVLFSAGCGRFIRAEECPPVDRPAPGGSTGVCVSGGFSFADDLYSFSANSVYETREFDPSVYAQDNQSTPVGSIRVTLANGSVITYQDELTLDSTTALAPRTPGYQVLVYRPADASALQAFISAYRDDAVQVEVSSTVRLRDISSGTVGSTHIDSRGSFDGTLRVIGSVGSVPPTFSIFHRDV